VKEAEQYINFIENFAIPKAISSEEVRKETLEDGMLQMVIENLQTGCWNEYLGRVDTDKMKTFKKIRSELSETRDEGTEIVVPTKR